MSKEIQNIVDQIIRDTGTESHQVIPVLQAIQDKFNYLPEEALVRVCDTTEITAAQIFGISTFYSQFRHKATGMHIIKICIGTACHVKGAMQVYDGFKRHFNIPETEDTDTEGLFTIEKVACLGCCTIAPVVQIGDITYGHVDNQKIPEIIQDFLSHANDKPVKVESVEGITKFKQGEIRIGLGSCCVASGSYDVKQALEKSLTKNDIHVDVKHVGCVGICNQVPMLEIHKENETPAIYTKIKPDEVNQVIKTHFKPDSFSGKIKSSFYNFFENIAFQGLPGSTKRYSYEDADTPVSEFLEDQINIATEYRGILKPTDLGEYKSLGGFSALKKCLKELSSEQIIDQIKLSGIKGRGGAGFPSGTKWQLVHSAKSDNKYVICNGDEGDPGAFMDRMLLESYPFRVLEGILIAACAVGANKGILYIRAEYPLAVKRIKEAIEICRKEGLIGKKILGTKFSIELEVFEGAGAFVCGEETALIASIEGKRGLPTMRPPYPAEKGLWGKPTLINNTETFSLIPWIIKNGATAFHDIGTDHSKGTKVFALAGKINRGGLIEVPMGISIRQIVEKIGGGIADGKQFKAVQIGGPSGGCIPAEMSHISIDFASLHEVGAMMGSGGLVVLDESDCMVDIARYFLEFTQDQSCGRCTFCRIGTRKMLEILNKICSGKGTKEDLKVLEHLAYQTKKGSLCGLGKTAPNPVLSTLKYFREEYEAHIKGECPTGKCKDLIEYSITEDCIGCTKCAQKCPVDAIEMKPYETHEINTEKCVKCDVCRQVCPVDSVIVIKAYKD
ncbi:MAG: NAD(P)H-dependent oxidoreductase subunit E [Bacteroidales bacterium]|nr:NAD(P)H-dependent oxidoreductase subunit E [Bacteroidales bacterium]